MKKIFVFANMLIMVLFLAGCCKHEWVDADCDTPIRCTKCGKEKGQALGHEWADATCAAPQTCTRCGLTMGTTLPHTWVEATCTAPKTCSVCNATEGDILPHEWNYATFDTPKTCKNCGLTEGEPITLTEVQFDFIDKARNSYFFFLPDTIIMENSNEFPTVHILDYDGNEIKKINDDKDKNGGCSTAYSWDVNLDNSFAICTTDIDKDKNHYIRFYDEYGELLKEHTFTLNVPNVDYLYLRTSSLNHYPLFYSQMSLRPLVCIDPKTLEIVDESETGGVQEYKNNKKFKDITVLYHIDGDYRFVRMKDNSGAGYTDCELNEIKMYKDATNFNIRGYALVSEDGENYDLIDNAFNVVAKGFTQGKKAYFCGDYYFYVIDSENKRHYFCVK